MRLPRQCEVRSIASSITKSQVRDSYRMKGGEAQLEGKSCISLQLNGPAVGYGYLKGGVPAVKPFTEAPRSVKVFTSTPPPDHYCIMMPLDISQLCRAPS
jgi:hypothetical protein